MEAIPPKHCPGVASETAGKAGPCEGCPNQKICSSGDAQKAAQAEMDTVIPQMRSRLSKVKHIILVMSGKGGTGKSTISSMLARALARDPSTQVGLLDLDICGPSTPRMLGVEGEQVHKSSSGWVPVYPNDNLAVMSCGFLLGSLDDAVIWRGPKKNTMIKQFLIDVDWDELDYLIIDTPPGTSDEHISTVQLLKQTGLSNLEGVVMVSTPQEVCLMDVRKQIDFCRRTGLRILGIIENMSKFLCPKCSKEGTFFPSADFEKMSSDNNIDILGHMPLCSAIGELCDAGLSVFDEFERSQLGEHYKDENRARVLEEHLKTIRETFLCIRDKLLAKVSH